MKLVSVIVVNWNNWKLTNDCLASLQGLRYDPSAVIVVDNGSTDGSVKGIRDRFPDVEIIENGANLGFAKGNNAGIRLALQRGAEYVWLLNNDTIVDSNALLALVEKAESDPKIGAVGSAVYYMSEPDRLQAWGGGYVNFWLGRPRRFLRPVADEKIEFVMGASLLMRREALQSVGLLDERFFMYWEDAEFGFRLRRAGWRLAVAGESKVWHKIGATSRNKGVRLDATLSRSGVHFFKRNSPVPLISIGSNVILRIVKRALARDWVGVRNVWNGMEGDPTSEPVIHP